MGVLIRNGLARRWEGAFGWLGTLPGRVAVFAVLISRKTGREG